MTMRQGVMTVGELSRRTGVPVKNLRRYTDWGLIYSAGRSGAGYRLYNTDAFWCVEMIGTLRSLGLTLAEIRELVEQLDAGQPLGGLLADLLRASRARVRTRIDELQRTLHRIDSFVETHRSELAEAVDTAWAGDPRCGITT